MKLTTDWLDNVLTKNTDEAWGDIFNYLGSLIPSGEEDLKVSYRKLEDEVAYIDHVLASSAWDLWKDFSKAPRASDYVKTFWNNTIGPKAVLILDSLSIREVNPIVSELSKNNLFVKHIGIAGSEIPSETDIYANALGISGRALLARGNSLKGFQIDTNHTFVDTFRNVPFTESTLKLSNEKNIFLWHSWPDDALHVHGKYDDAFNQFIEHVQEILTSEGFLSLIKKMSHGRELLITSDHGYCNTSSFSSATGEHHNELKLLGHSRAKKASEILKSAGKTVPPATMELKASANGDLYRVAVGRRRPTDKGFPALTHGGLSLMECAVPLITVSGIK